MKLLFGQHSLAPMISAAALVIALASSGFASGTSEDTSDLGLLEKDKAAEAAPVESGIEGGEHGAGNPQPLLELPEFLPNFVSFFTFHPDMHENTIVQWLHIYAWENILFSSLTALLMVCGVVLVLGVAKVPTSVPTRSQTLLEMVVEGLDGIVCGVIGPEGRKYTPFIGSLFLYIWCMNMQGLLPGLKSPTSYIGVTAGLGVMVFCYVQYVGVRENGIINYFLHLAGSPADLVGWIMSPLMFVLHVVGELIKPLSLSLRLFGNIMGEDALIGVFALLGIVLLSVMGGGPTSLESMMGLKAQYETADLAAWQWFGLPLQLPFMFLALLTGTIQALVFSLLSTIYIFLMLPHGEHAHEEHGEHGHEAAHGHEVKLHATH